MSGALAKTWSPGDEVVVTRLDHDANVRPWVQAAERVGAVVRWADPDLVSGELLVDAVMSLLSQRTRLLAVTAASNVLGTRPDLAAISAAARDVGALVHVDGVHLTPHAPVSMDDLGADFYATSSYKWSGPHVAAVAADPALLDRLHPDKLASSPDAVPERFERGTSPFADLAGMAAAVDHLADLDDEATGTRRERLLASMSAVQAYEQELFANLLAGLEQVPGVRLYGAPARRTATAFFRVEGRTPREVAEYLAAAKVNVWAGHMYAWELTGALGIRADGGAVRAGLAHYNDSGDVEALLAGLAELT
jgi:cysteine desulfurase family protein (TIGR01976 family)